MSVSRSSSSTCPGFLRKKNGPKPRRPRKPKPPSAPFPSKGRSESTATRVQAMTAKLNQANFCVADMAFLPGEDNKSRLNPPLGNVMNTLHNVKYRLLGDRSWELKSRPPSVIVRERLLRPSRSLGLRASVPKKDSRGNR